ncbi:MAG: 4Fe-4S dicluster domain-containing protein [Deltaproteobacteria bacterium]|nr:MAG: 4Fe-4S dicluster domain-containing protein [Deltaproteobacteria bacterium]
MARLNRRDFLKALGIAGAASAAACGWDDNWYRTPVEELLPYVVKPEQVTPGTPTFFATTVTTGPAAWPVTGRHRDGRVINVGANTQAPGFGGGVPKAALLELQRHYSPDRLRAPLAGGAESSWDAAAEKLAEAVGKARAAGKKVVWFGPHQSGALAQLLADYTQGNNLHWEPLGRSDEADAAETVFGERRLPRYELGRAHFVLSFGAPFLGSWGGLNLERGFADAKNPNKGNFIARHALIAPHVDQTGANADDWYACGVGAEASAAFAVAKLIASKKGYAGGASQILSGVDVAKAASASGVSQEQLQEVADRFAQAEAAVALPGATPDADLAIACFLINIVSGNLNRTFFADGYAGPIHGLRHVKALVEELNAGKVGVLLVGDTNPVYSLPPSLGFAEAAKKADLMACLSDQPTETTALASLILPVANTLEDWGDEDLDATTRLLRQPTMTPLWSSRSLGEVLLKTARAAGLKPLPVEQPPSLSQPEDGSSEGDSEDVDPSAPQEQQGAAPLAFEPSTWRDYLVARWQRQVYPRAQNPGSFQEFWLKSLRQGVAKVRSDATPPTVRLGAYSPPERNAASGIGLQLFAHPHRYDGRYANAAWAQEVADPMTGQVWDSWVELSPELAAELGVKDRDEVELTTAAGSFRVGVEVYPGLKGKTAAFAFGQGHRQGRYADKRGQNAFALAAAEATDSVGNPLLGGLSVQIKKTGARSDIWSTFGGDSDGGRYWGVAVNAPALAKVGDKPSDHPGELTGIHHLGRDPRLEEKSRKNFYDPPDHPTYRFAMTVDTNACDGCGVCVIACYAENNLPIVGKGLIKRGREMNWLRINRFWEENPDGSHDIRFIPVMCQHCALAPCESVCPVLATYHNLDGLNAMVYNRCVGTRYCANNCPYVVRRFNFHSYAWPDPLTLQLNPDVSVRTMGVMEKCTFCVQRTRNMKDAYRDRDVHMVPDEALRQLPACAEACPTDALTFGNLKDERSAPAQTRKSARSYIILEELNTVSAVNYLAKANFHVPEAGHHGSGHGHDDDHSTDHHDAEQH